MPSLGPPLEAASPEGPRPRFLTLDTAEVRYAVPALNAYVIAPSQNPAYVGESLNEYAVALGGAGTKYGSSGAVCYLPGTIVLIARLAGSDSALDSISPATLNIILGAVPTSDIDDPKYYQSSVLSPIPGLDHYTIPYAKSIQTANQDSEIIRDRSYGTPSDALPGDWGMTGELGCGVRISQAGAHFGSAMACLRIDPLKLGMSVEAVNAVFSSLASEEGWRLDKTDMLYYSRRAASIAEGLGVVSGNPFKKEDDDYKPVKEDQRGIFRTETMEGWLADGKWDVTSIPENAEGARDKSRSKPPFGVISGRAGYNGLTETLSALEATSVKTPYIPLAMDLKPEELEEKLAKDADEKSWKDSKNISNDDYPNLAPANNTDEFDTNTTEYWRARMRGRTKNWKIPSPDDIKSEYGLEMDRRKQLDAIGETTQDYDLPPYVTVTDPVTKKKMVYYASESFIRQLPDGSISISDGYGSEIRMVRGRIIISPSTDLELRPGRDSHLLAGRHVVSNAGASMFLQAAKGSLYAKAETDMALLAGNSGDGTLLLESRGKHKSKGHSNESDQRVEGGIMVKSKGGLGLVGSQVYLGVLDERDSSKGGVDGTKGLSTSSITIDARAGVLGLAGGTIYGSAKSGLVMGCHEGNGSMLALGVGSYSLVASRGALGSSITRIGPPSGSVNIPKITASGVFPSTVIGGEGQGQVDISGSVTVEKNVTSGGKMHANSMEAPGFSSAYGSHQDYSHKGGSSADAKVGKITVPVAEKVSTAASNAFRICADQYKINTGVAQAKTGMAYPAGSDLGLGSYKLYAARWQNMLKDKGADSNKRKEKTVESPDGKDTMVYPGNKTWTEPNFVVGDNSNGVILDGGYISNAKQEVWYG